MPIAAGRRMGPYEVLDALGAGGMGEVYRARDPRLDREVALEVAPRGHSSDPDRLRRFRREAKALAALSHPNILAVHDADWSDGTAYAVFELLEGETLRQRLDRGPLPARKVVAWGAQICRGLGAAHARGIVHRDLKPENLAFAADGSIKILDFGLARFADAPGETGPRPKEGSTATQAGVVLGTSGYMSPEQARGLPPDARSDLFAVGAILYEMLAGRRAFEGPTAADTISDVLHRDPPAATAGPEPVPVCLERIVRRCLEKDPDDRFQTARDLAFALESLCGSAGSELHRRARSGSPRGLVREIRRHHVLHGEAHGLVDGDLRGARPSLARIVHDLAERRSLRRPHAAQLRASHGRRGESVHRLHEDAMLVGERAGQLPVGGVIADGRHVRPGSYPARLDDGRRRVRGQAHDVRAFDGRPSLSNRARLRVPPGQ